MQRQTQLANELWPLLLPKIKAAGFIGGTSAAGGVGEHELGGGQHKGTLLDTQAPQFLLRNGARALTGNLAVDADITIDGIDIAAHAGNPDAHHARQHGILAGADHTVSGSQWQIVGLTAANTLGLLTPSAAPGANTVVRTNGSSSATLQTAEVVNDLYVGTLDFGTNTLYEDATYLRVAGSKAVRFAQNIGNANWTVYDAGGADFSGNVNVLAGGDLSVAGSGFYAGNPVLFADSSGGNVGILCTFDP